MKTVLRHHPLKIIQLRFQDNVVPPEFELTALREYYTAHDKTWELKIQYEEQKGRLTILHNEIFDHHMSREQLEEELKTIEETLHNSAQVDPVLFFDKIVDHNKKMQDIHSKVAKYARLYNDAIAKLHEDTFLIERHYFHLFREVFQRYEEVQVDTVSLDADYQEFLRMYNKVDELFKDYMATGDEVFDAYAYLYEENEAFYKRAEVLQREVGEL